MNLNAILYVPKHVVFRRYDEIDVYDLLHDESYLIDDEAYDLLKRIDGKSTCRAILEQYAEENRDDILEVIKQFYDMEIIQLSFHELTDETIINNELDSLPKKNPFAPPYLKNLMINITEKCNLSCKHCYITDKNQEDMPLDKIKSIVKDFHELQGIRLILTGGEPFLYKELKSLLIFLKEISLQKVFLSNGTLIKKDPELLELMKDNHVEVYVSLDGLEQAHNDFRDSNCFKDTIEGIKILLDAGINVSINTMVHKKNLNDFEGMYELITSLGKIKNWAIDIPTLDESTPQEIRERYEITFKEGGKILKDYGWGVIFESEGGPVDYACGPFLMAIDVKGKVTKCGFFSNLSPGNVFDIGLRNSWERIQTDCNWSINDLKCIELDCEFIGECRGGCRYRAYRNDGKITGIDSFKCYQFGKLK